LHVAVLDSLKEEEHLLIVLTKKLTEEKYELLLHFSYLSEKNLDRDKAFQSQDNLFKIWE
jgi:hypothetical protein